jgi:hypothetical protein
MCKSKANGGQRCYSHALAKMTTVETKYRKTFTAAKAAEAAGSPKFEKLKAKSLALYAKLDDARAVYASTPKGEADLRAKMVTAPSPNAFKAHDPHTLHDSMDLDLVIHRGKQIRER